MKKKILLSLPTALIVGVVPIITTSCGKPDDDVFYKTLNSIKLGGGIITESTDIKFNSDTWTLELPQNVDLHGIGYDFIIPFLSNKDFYNAINMDTSCMCTLSIIFSDREDPIDAISDNNKMLLSMSGDHTTRAVNGYEMYSFRSVELTEDLILDSLGEGEYRLPVGFDKTYYAYSYYYDLQLSQSQGELKQTVKVNKLDHTLTVKSWDPTAN